MASFFTARAGIDPISVLIVLLFLAVFYFGAGLILSVTIVRTFFAGEPFRERYVFLVPRMCFPPTGIRYIWKNLFWPRSRKLLWTVLYLFPLVILLAALLIRR